MVNTAGEEFLPLLTELARSGVQVRLAGDGRLEVRSSGGRLPGGLRDRIAAVKPELVAWLARDRAGEPGDVREFAGPLTVRADPDHRYAPFHPSDLQTSFLIGSREGFEHHVRPHQYLEFDFGELDPERFETALNAALYRQRANLVVVRDELRLAAVRDPEPVRVRVSDLRGRPAAQVRAGIDRMRAAMRRRELPLDHWPWMDVAVTRYADGRGRLHYNNNNFFSDAPGTFRFLDSVLALYRDPDAELGELPASFRDCVLALAELEDSPDGQAARRYWCDRMAAWPGPPELPLASRADPRRRSRLVRRELTLPGEDWAAIKRQASARGLTPTSAACAAHAEILACWSGSRHFLLNNMITHRLTLRPEFAEIIGNLAALYPLEVDWRRPESFADRARRLQARVVADMAHTQWSGTKVLQTLNQIRRSPGRAACPYAVGSALFVGPVDRPRHSQLETPQVIFDCEFWELRDGRLWVVWDVIEEMFPAGLLDSMQQGYLTMLTSLAEGTAGWDAVAPDLLAADVPHRPGPPPVVLPDTLLHDPLPARATELAGRPAVVTPDTVLDYAGLHARSLRIAGLLPGHGVRPGDLVAVAAAKGWPQVVAVLAVLTAGAAYVPIDPRWPAERIRLLLDDTAARVVLTDQDHFAALTAITGTPVLAVDVPNQPGPGTAAPVRPDRRPTELAYVIYTSGSTGRPKGAMLDHRGPRNTIADVNHRFGIGSHDVIFGLSSLCFDLSVYDIFGAIDAGATLVLPTDEQSDPASWLELVRRHRVTVWNSVPALMELFVAEAEAAGVRLPALRTVLLSGDWIAVDLPGRIRAVAPNARVISLGGATEASIWSICYPVDHPDPDWASIPYGRPLANQSWHVLDELGRDAPTWTPGELYIGGAGLALGYLGDAERTAAAFVAHPRTGERLYRTGDRGRYLPGGDIEFLGRADFQVKIQGFRVEPGEVENALADCPVVRQAVVIARDSGAGKQLAAFVTGAVPDRPPVPAELRASLAQRLPAHLVPSTITVLTEFPLTGNGKLDRKRLGELRAGDAEPVPRMPPRTELERDVAAIWSEVLDCGPVSVHDDFFDLGGQSYAALRVSGLLARRLGHQVSLGTLLERRTVAALAEWLAAADGRWTPRVWLHRPAGPRPWFFVHPAGGGVLCYRQLAESLDEPFCAFQAPGRADGRQPAETVAELAATYLPELLEVQPHGPYRLGGWSSGAVIALELAHQLESRGEVVDRIVVVDAPAPTDSRPITEDELLPWFLADHGIEPDDQNGPAPRLDADLRAAFAVFRGVVRACHDYAAPTVAAPITVLRAATGTVSEFEPHPATAAPDWGWAALTTGPVRTSTVPGTHHTLLRDPQVAAVSRAIAAEHAVRKPDAAPVRRSPT